MNILRSYNEFLKRKPLMANMVTSGILFGAGDAIAQGISIYKSLENSQQYHYNIGRTIRNMIYGGILFAPIAHRLYGFLNNRVRFPWKIGREAGRVQLGLDTLARVAFDQLVWSPVGIVLYFGTMSLLEEATSSSAGGKNLVGRAWDRGEAKVKSQFRATLVANWQVWPVFQAVNFSVVPPAYRVGAVNVVSVLWNAFLSARNSAPVPPQVVETL